MSENPTVSRCPWTPRRKVAAVVAFFSIATGFAGYFLTWCAPVALILGIIAIFMRNRYGIAGVVLGVVPVVIIGCVMVLQLNL